MADIQLYNFDNTLSDISGQLGIRSRRIYANDARYFAKWLIEQNIHVDQITRSQFIAYRQHLNDSEYKKSTAQRMFTVAKKILKERVINGQIEIDPTNEVKNFKRDSESHYTALTVQQCKELLSCIDRTTTNGQRNYAIILLLLRTGLRRFECSALNVGDIKQEQGHIIAEIKHGKGDKPRVIKLPVDVFRAIQEYMQAVERTALEAPLFTGTGRLTRINDKTLERIVIDAGKQIGVNITPHNLRATFITLALEAGAPLQKVQYAVGHSDPRTTERYQDRKTNLDDNAVDYVRF